MTDNGDDETEVQNNAANLKSEEHYEAAEDPASNETEEEKEEDAKDEEVVKQVLESRVDGEFHFLFFLLIFKC